MRWTDFDSNDAPEGSYGEVGPTMRAFEDWVCKNVGGGYSPLEQAHDEDFTSLGEEGVHSVGANRYFEMVTDNIDIYYDWSCTTKPHIERVLDGIAGGTGTWERLIEEAEEYFCSCDNYAFTDEKFYED